MLSKREPDTNLPMPCQLPDESLHHLIFFAARGWQLCLLQLRARQHTIGDGLIPSQSNGMAWCRFLLLHANQQK